MKNSLIESHFKDTLESKMGKSTFYVHIDFLQLFRRYLPTIHDTCLSALDIKKYEYDDYSISWPFVSTTSPSRLLPNPNYFLSVFLASGTDSNDYKSS